MYDLNEPAMVSRFEKLGKRLKIIIDDDGAHGKEDSGETLAARRLAKSAGAANVKRQHMGKLQHNKTIVVDGPKVQAAVCGSTNHSWRGFFVQNNNAIILRGKSAVKIFLAAFEAYWNNDDVAGFCKTGSATWKAAPPRWRMRSIAGVLRSRRLCRRRPRPCRALSRGMPAAP